MQLNFRNRADLIAYVRAAFPAATAIDPTVVEVRGGRAAATCALASIDPAAYARTRNHLAGAVTRLSPYLRHGVLSLAEVRDAALQRVASPGDAAKLINELGWRDYYRRVYAQIGAGIWRDLEASKSGWRTTDYAATLPADIEAGVTGLACIDAFSRDLRTTGYLHNHARMWLAAYIVHFRRVRWQAGARWFLTHLLDGDPASNNLSWQWVASTFSHKPYFFNRENLEKQTDGHYCRVCPQRGRCEFEGSYEQLAQRLFPHAGSASSQDTPAAQLASLAPPVSPEQNAAPPAPLRPIVWLHGDNLNPFSPALTAHPGAPAIWVWDDALLTRARLSLKRVVFLYECLLELPVTIRRGDVAAEVRRFAGEHRADGVVTNASPAPGFARVRQTLAEQLPVDSFAEDHTDAFVVAPAALDLRRFSRYWRSVERSAMTPTPSRQAL